MNLSYPPFLPWLHASLAEPSPSWDPFSERHLHCIWFDDRLRPERLYSADGEEIRILHPGHWNMEKGPDFKEAEWEAGGRRGTGDVEIHIRPADWLYHEHHTDPAYARVGLHVTYEPGEIGEEHLPPGCLQVCLKPHLMRRSHFFFDAIDPSAYPARGESGRNGLRAFFADRSEEEQAGILEAAGMERLRRKAIQFQHTARSVGVDQALWRGFLRGLGYKHNAEVATRLASALPVSILRSLSDGETAQAYALILGVAGLLPEDPHTRGFPDWITIRELWDRWWPHQARFLGRALTGEEWRLDGCRPGNHPWRRLWAAAGWVCEAPALEDLVVPPVQMDKGGGMARVLKRLQCPAHGNGPALVGPQRAGALVLNTVVPYWISIQDTAPEEGFWRHLPSEPMNAITRRTARTLFGPDAHPRISRGGLRRQGLYQFHEDFDC